MWFLYDPGESTSPDGAGFRHSIRVDLKPLMPTASASVAHLLRHRRAFSNVLEGHANASPPRPASGLVKLLSSHGNFPYPRQTSGQARERARERALTSQIIPVETFDLIVFGGTGRPDAQ